MVSVYICVILYGMVVVCVLHWQRVVEGLREIIYFYYVVIFAKWVSRNWVSGIGGNHGPHESCNDKLNENEADHGDVDDEEEEEQRGVGGEEEDVDEEYVDEEYVDEEKEEEEREEVRGGGERGGRYCFGGDDDDDVTHSSPGPDSRLASTETAICFS